MKHRVIISLLALLMTVAASAQDNERDYELAPYGFVGIQGGLNNTWSNPGVRDWKPIFGAQVGYFFTEVFGTRLQGTFSPWKVDLADGTQYDAKRMGIDMDVLFNFSNLVFPGRSNLVNVIGVAGVPFELAVPHTKLDIPATADNGSHASWKTGWRGGGILQFNINKNFAIDLEGGTSYIMKRSTDQVLYNRWWPYAMAGITYKFGHKKVAAPVPVTIPQPVAEEKPAPRPEPKPEPKPESKPQPVVEQPKAPATLTQNVFFNLNDAAILDSETSKLDEVANWLKSNSDAAVQLTGYADVQTGNTQLNQKLSERRAAAVKAALVKRGISADRIATDAKGDTVQPFSVNEQNRAVIVVCKGK